MGRSKRGIAAEQDEIANRSSSSRRGNEGSNTLLIASDEISALRNENNSLKAKIAALSKEVKDLRADNNTLQSENNELRNERGKTGSKARSRGRNRGNKPVVHSEIHTVTDVDVLSVGLSYCGFDAKRQQRVNLDRNLRRFQSFFGIFPTTVAPILKDLKDANPNFVHKDSLMAMNWLYLYDTREVLSGRWGPHENEIGSRVIEYGKEIQKLKAKKIKFEFDKCSNGKYAEYLAEFIAGLDTCTFLAQEFRLDPSAGYYDHKSHSSGLVSDNSDCFAYSDRINIRATSYRNMSFASQ